MTKQELIKAVTQTVHTMDPQVFITCKELKEAMRS